MSSTRNQTRDEGIVVTKVKGWFARFRRRDAVVAEVKMLASEIPEALVRVLQNDTAKVGILKSKIDVWIAKGDAQAKLSALEKYIPVFETHRRALEAHIALRRADHDHQNLKTVLADEDAASDRARELAAKKHQTAILGEDAAQHELREKMKPVSPPSPPTSSPSAPSVAERVRSKIRSRINHKRGDPAPEKQFHRDLARREYEAEILIAEHNRDGETAEQLKQDLEFYLEEVDSGEARL